jgi:hypothetical protein
MSSDRKTKLTEEDLRNIGEALAAHPEWDIGTLQVVIYVAAGGGWIGRHFALSPADAYIDSRVGELPYSRAEIEMFRKVLVKMAEVRGLDPYNLPELPNFHGCCVF